MAEITNFIKSELRVIISKHLNAKRAGPGYDLITDRILKELPELNINYFTQLFNSILRIGYFPLRGWLK